MQEIDFLSQKTLDKYLKVKGHLHEVEPGRLVAVAAPDQLRDEEERRELLRVGLGRLQSPQTFPDRL